MRALGRVSLDRRGSADGDLDSRAGHWLTLRLVGDPKQRCPRDATGSVVFLTAGGARQRGEVASGRSLLSQSDRRVHFGLGPATRVDRLEVRWANGPTVAYGVSAIDTELVVDQARGTATESQRPGRP